MQVVEITDPHELAALRSEWRALVDDCAEAGPFQSPEWLIVWREAFLPGGGREIYKYEWGARDQPQCRRRIV